MISRKLIIGALSLCATAYSSFAATLPVSEDSYTTPKNTVTLAGGKATSLPITPTQDALIKFDLSQLSSNYTSNSVETVYLRIYVSRLSKAGNIAIHKVTSTWSETVAGDAPTMDAAPITTITAANIASKRFISIDVTSTVQEWLDSPSSNFGFAIIAAGVEPVTKLVLGSKEGPATGFPAELEVENGLDSRVVAWGRITAGGTLDSGYNVASVTRNSAGNYNVVLDSPLSSGFTIMPAVTPELDAAPVGAANVRFAVTNEFAAGTNFDIYVYDGNFNPADSDVHFIITGR